MTAVGGSRDERITIRLSAGEAERLRALAEVRGVAPPELLRRMIADGPAEGMPRPLEMIEAVEEALAAVTEPDKRDAGARELARAYAAQIDSIGVDFGADAQMAALGQLGPKLLATLTALGLTPAGRGGTPKAVTPNGPVSTFAGVRDEVAEQRAKRTNVQGSS